MRVLSFDARSRSVKSLVEGVLGRGGRKCEKPSKYDSKTHKLLARAFGARTEFMNHKLLIYAKCGSLADKGSKRAKKTQPLVEGGVSGGGSFGFS